MPKRTLRDLQVVAHRRGIVFSVLYEALLTLNPRKMGIFDRERWKQRHCYPSLCYRHKPTQFPSVMSSRFLVAILFQPYRRVAPKISLGEAV